MDSVTDWVMEYWFAAMCFIAVGAFFHGMVGLFDKNIHLSSTGEVRSVEVLWLYKIRELLKLAVQIVLGTIGIGLAVCAVYLIGYVFLYLGLVKGIGTLVRAIGEIEPSSQAAQKLAVSVIALGIGLLGIYLTVFLRKWFKAQELARNVLLLESERQEVIKALQNKYINLIPINVVEPSTLNELPKFLSIKDTLIVLRVAVTCKTISERAREIRLNRQGDRTDEHDKKQIEELSSGSDYLDSSLGNIYKNLRSPRYVLNSTLNRQADEDELFGPDVVVNITNPLENT